MAEKITSPNQTSFRRGFVKQVLCGDAVVLQVSYSQEFILDKL